MNFKKIISVLICASILFNLPVTASAVKACTEITRTYNQEIISAEEMYAKEKEKKPEKTPITKDALPEVLDYEAVKGQGYVSRLKSEEQDMCEIVLENEDGSRGVYVFDSPVKFTNEKGEIVDKSNKVKRFSENGAACFKSESNDIDITLPVGLQSGLAFEAEDVNIGMKPITSVFAQRAVSVGEQKDEDSVIYENVFDESTDIVYTFTYDGVKEDIVLEKYNGKSTFDFEVITGGLSLEEEKGMLLLKDENGEVKATMGEIIIFSADNKNNTSGKYKITEKQKNNSYTVTLCVDTAYLTSPETKYPVTIDPTISSVTTDCGIEDMQVFKGKDGTGATETSAGKSGVSRIGWTNWGACRTLVKISENLLKNKRITRPEQINSAFIEFRDLMAQSCSTMISCYQFAGTAWSESDTKTWNQLGANKLGTLAGKKNVSAATGSTPAAAYGNSTPDKWDLWHRFNLTAVVRTWAGNSTLLKKGLIFKADTAALESSSGAANMKTFSSVQGNANYKPYFYINYTIPTTGISISKSSLALDVGKTYSLSATIKPSDATNKTVTWSSSNTAVATVSSSGTVTAKSAGIATITVKSKANSSVTATCKVTVKLPDGDNDGIPDSEDPEPQRENKWFEYNRQDAVEYARRWYDGRNRGFYSYESDCANFVSQCLNAGGFAMTDEWHSIRGKNLTYEEIDLVNKIKIPFSDDAYKYYYEWDVTVSWRSAPDLGKYLKDNNYTKNKITINKTTNIKNFISKYDIKEGDVMLFDDNSDGIPNHATIICNVDCEKGEIQYSAHTESRIDHDVYEFYLAPDSNHSAIILRINEGKMIYE